MAPWVRRTARRVGIFMFNNFVGAERELNEACNTDTISRFLSKQGADFIKWKRNSPLASHMGGVWERQMRSVRAILCYFRVFCQQAYRVLCRLYGFTNFS